MTTMSICPAAGRAWINLLTVYASVAPVRAWVDPFYAYAVLEGACVDRLRVLVAPERAYMCLV